MRDIRSKFGIASQWPLSKEKRSLGEWSFFDDTTCFSFEEYCFHESQESEALR